MVDSIVKEVIIGISSVLLIIIMQVFQMHVTKRIEAAETHAAIGVDKF